MTDEQTAAAIVADQMNAVSETAMEAAIVRALQQAREEGKRSSFDSTNPPDPKPLVWLNGKKVAPAGHIIDDQGVVRRVLGTLPVTADGVVVCYAATPLWHPVLGQMDTLAGEPYATWRNGMGKRTSECYSTPDAAEAAKEDER